MCLLNWCVKHMLKKQNKINGIIRKWQNSYLKRRYKFGIELPKTVEQDLSLDTKNGNTLLADAIPKEMEIVKVAFEVLPDVRSVAIGH